MTTLNDLVEQISMEEKQNDVAVAAAADLEVLEAVNMAIARNIASFSLFDDEAVLKNMLRENYPHLLGHPNIRLVNVNRKSTRLNSSHVKRSYAVFWLKKK